MYSPMKSHPAFDSSIVMLMICFVPLPLTTGWHYEFEKNRVRGVRGEREQQEADATQHKRSPQQMQIKAGEQNQGTTREESDSAKEEEARKEDALSRSTFVRCLDALQRRDDSICVCVFVCVPSFSI